ncbi:MAG: Gfo/Idh/MocA family oxidoreductase [Geminicoccaceae bacterium]
MAAARSGKGPVGVGLIGCGFIAGAYLTAARTFPDIAVRAVADRDESAAVRRGAEFGVPAVSVDALLANPAIEIVLNLTTPPAHVPVALQAIAAGKHVYTEKPLGVRLDEARRLVAAADAAGLRVGGAPDTFLGGGLQTARRVIDEGAIGRPVAGTAFLQVAGHERWHPGPEFYYAAEGGGPMLDMGPYYLTALVNLLGPVRRVTGMASVGRAERVIGQGPRAGTHFAVHTPTHVAGTLGFASGAVVTIVTSFEVWKHSHVPLELYGTAGSLQVPDPNRFDGEVRLCPANGDWTAVPGRHGYALGNWRILGVADMARAIRTGRPHRASGALALHVLEVMEALVACGAEGGAATIASTVERPAAMPEGLADGELDD